MKSRTTLLAASGALLALFAIIGFIAVPNSVRRSAAGPSSHAGQADSLASRAAIPSSTNPLVLPQPVPGSSLLSRIELVFAKFLRGEGSAGDLATLKRDLSRAEPREAIIAISTFLQSGRDAKTGHEFSVGAGGALDGAPTLRVFLLDLLGSLARPLRSDEAATIARTILESKSSSAEWAISLRNVAWNDPNAAPFLSGKIREMLSYEPWLQSPDPGMLEAFDVAVFTRDPTLIAPLAEALRSDRPPLQRAAAIALDRLAERAPFEVMTYLNANPGAMSDRPFVRADYFAKADLSQPAQRQAVEVYLQRADIANAEKAKMIEALAAPASFVSESLLTTAAPEPDEATRNATIAAVTTEWLAGKQFLELRPQIAELHRQITGP